MAPRSQQEGALRGSIGTGGPELRSRKPAQDCKAARAKVSVAGRVLDSCSTLQVLDSFCQKSGRI